MAFVNTDLHQVKYYMAFVKTDLRQVKCYMVSNYYFPETLAIMFSRNVNTYIVQKCWQLKFPETLAILISIIVNTYNYQRC